MLKSITLHRPAIDNLQNFHDAGADLIVGEDEAEGVISPERARDLVASHGAVGHHTKVVEPKSDPAPVGDGKKAAD